MKCQCVFLPVPEQAKCVGVAGFVSVNEGLNLLDVCFCFSSFFFFSFFVCGTLSLISKGVTKSNYFPMMTILQPIR